MKIVKVNHIVLALLMCPMSFVSFGEEVVRIQTPNVAEYQKIGTYQMNYSTGVPNIEIPIYTITIGNFKLPISLKYHASGIKVQEVPTSVGLGWMLSAGGCISVDVKGKRDTEQSLYASNEEEFESLSLGTMLDIITLGSDSERDTYNYTFPGHSGSFRYSQSDDSIRTIPYDPIRVDSLGTRQYFKGYRITDTEGNKFYFQKPEKVLFFSGNGFENCAWHLSKIEPAQSTDSIVFNYMESTSSIISTALSGYYGSNIISRDVNTITYPMLINSIQWEGGTVHFSYEERVHGNGAALWHRLKSMDVKNYMGNVVHHTQFVHSYIQNQNSYNSKRIMLDTVIVNGDRYAFEYNDTKLPNYTYGSDINCYEDFWGYYNVNTAQGYWFPAEFSEPAAVLEQQSSSRHCANRSPNEYYCKAASLTKIIYPTGGYTVFDFESNYIEEDGIWGGLRLKNYSSYQADGTLSLQRTYRYFDAVAPYCVLNPLNMQVRQDLYFRDYPSRLCSGIPAPYFGAPAALLYREWRGSPVRPLTEGSAPIHYLKVAEYDGTTEDYFRKTLYDYTRFYPELPQEDSNSHSDESIILWDPAYNYDRGNPVYQLGRKRIYQKMPAGNDSLLYEETNTYFSGTITMYDGGVRIRPKLIINRPGGIWNTPDVESVFYEYSISTVHVVPSYNLLSMKTIKQDGIILKEEYEYDEHLRTTQPLVKITSRSDGKTSKTIYTYPFQDSHYSGMVEANIQIPVKEETYIDSLKVSSVNTAYQQISGKWLPSSISIGMSNTPTLRTTYSYNTRGKIKCVAKDETTYINYVYGYNGTLPVAEIVADCQLQCSDIDVVGDQLTVALNNLRNQYEANGYLVTTYKYNPLVGIVWMKDSNRCERSFMYDSKGRLIGTMDHYGSMETGIEYNLKQ